MVAIPQPSPLTPQPITCTHAGAIPGLDACYCPGCRRSFEYWTAEYQSLMGCPGVSSQQPGVGSQESVPKKKRSSRKK